MKTLTKYALVLPLFFLFSAVKAQDSIPPIALVNQDSIRLEQYNTKIQLIENQRVADSVKKAELLAEIQSLKTTDNLKKETLQAQLDAISSQETERLASKKREVEALRATNKGVPVTGFFKDTLFTVYSRLGSFSPKERAKAVRERIQSLAGLRDFSTDSLVVESEYNILNLVYSDQIVTSISEEDALWSKMNAADLSIKYQKIISEAILNYQNETNIITLLKEFGLALLVLIITYLIIKYIFIAFRWTAIKIHAQ